MEYKGSNSWSDDSDEVDHSGSSRETALPVEPMIPAPNRPPLLNGVIFNRQERERSATEVARAIAPGIAAPEQILPPLIVQPEHLRDPQPPLSKTEYSPDDDDEEEPDRQDLPETQLPDTAPFVEEQQLVRHPESGPFLPPPSVLEIATPLEDDVRTTAVVPMAPPVAQQTTEQNQPLTPAETFPRVVSHEVDPSSPDQDQPEAYRPPALAAAPAEYVAPPPAAGGGEGTLPPPPERPVPSSQSPEPWERGHEWPAHAQQRAQSFNTYHPQPAETFARQLAESIPIEYRRQMVARSLLFLALGWYLGRRPVKQLRKEVSSLQETSKQQQAELTNLNYQHQEAQTRIVEQNRQIEQFTRPQAVPFQAEQIKAVRPPQPIESRAVVEQPTKIIAENGEEIVLLPGQRLVRRGAYSEVVDERNQVVQNIISHGREYRLDQSREQVSSPFGAQDARYTAGAKSYSGGDSGGGFANQPMASFGTSQSAQQYLPMNDAGQTPTEEAQHLLAPPKPNSVTSALTSPWLWLGVGILLIAFFAAATI